MKSSCNKIVVMGGSAGGLEAATRIIGDLPADFDGAVFLVLHLNASVPSMLPSILDRKTKLEVVVPQDGMRIACGTVYPAPPDRHLLVDNGVIRLGRGPRENNFRPAVDPLFRTAAAAYGEAVIGIVLSGNLDDGTAGLLAIKRAGGTAVVQDPEDAFYPGMPSSALQEVPEIEHCLPAKAIANVLIAWANADRAAVLTRPERAIPEDIAMGGEQPVDVDERKQEERGGPSKFGCPACGGVLKEHQDGEMVRFRCRVGHMFSDEALLAAQTDTLELALWTALRALEEAADQASTLHKRMKARGHEQLANRFARQAEDALRRASIVREALTYNQENAEQQMEAS